MSAARLAFVAALLALVASGAILLAWWNASAAERNGLEPDGVEPGAFAQEAAASAQQDAARLHRGESEEGSFQEALDAALRAAQAALPGADGRFEWELVSVSGVRGGIRGERTLVVEIRTR